MINVAAPGQVKMQTKTNQIGLLSSYAAIRGETNRKAIKNTIAIKRTAFK